MRRVNRAAFVRPGCCGVRRRRGESASAVVDVWVPHAHASRRARSSWPAAARCAEKLERLGLRWRFGGIDRVFSKAPRPLPAEMHISPDPYADDVVSQKPDAGEQVEPHAIVVLETECAMLRFKNSGCA